MSRTVPKIFHKDSIGRSTGQQPLFRTRLDHAIDTPHQKRINLVIENASNYGCVTRRVLLEEFLKEKK